MSLILIGVLSGCAFRNDKLGEIDNYLDSLHQSGNFDGSIVIGTKDGKAYAKHIGIAVREWSIPIVEDTRFDVASLNKSFVGYMVLQLEEAGMLDLSDPINKHLDFGSQFADQITIHQLLTHTSGLADYNAMSDSLRSNRFEIFKRLHFEADDYLKFIADLTPVASPGERFYYSNFGYHVLSILIEKLTASHFSEALDSMICRPLGMDQTYSPKDNYAMYPRLAMAYDKIGESFQKSPFIDYSLGRRIFSTTGDLYRWGREIAFPTLISDASGKVLLTNHIGKLNPTISYGYGWAVFDGKRDYQMGKIDVNENYVIHGGATDGYKSLLIIYNDGEWIISILGNIGDQIDELKTGEKLLKILIEKEK